MLLSAGVSFPCLTLKYRRFTFFNRRVGETPISHLYLTALFGEWLFQPVSQFLMYTKYTASPRGCGLSCSSSKYRRFTVFKQRAGETPASCLYPTALFGVLASHPKTAVWALKIKGRGAPALCRFQAAAAGENSLFRIKTLRSLLPVCRALSRAVLRLEKNCGEKQICAKAAFNCQKAALKHRFLPKIGNIKKFRVALNKG